MISPLLANITLHYVYDLWVEAWRKHHATGAMIVVRYADDTVVGFQHKDEADRFRRALDERLARFGLSLNGEKTRLIAFGRFVAEGRKRRGEKRPQTFDFLGFTHICGVKRNGRGFQLHRKTRRHAKQTFINKVTRELKACGTSRLTIRADGWPGYCRGIMPTLRYRPTSAQFVTFAMRSRCVGICLYADAANAAAGSNGDA